jgi:hypothetical protein
MTATDPLHHAEPTDSPHNAWRAGYRHGWNDIYNRVGHRKDTANPYPEVGIVVGPEDWGIVMDALIREREHALDRKRGNRASNSDDRAETCTRLIEAIGAAFNPQSTETQSQVGSTEGPEL